jgi:hypothetical protein
MNPMILSVKNCIESCNIRAIKSKRMIWGTAEPVDGAEAYTVPRHEGGSTSRSFGGKETKDDRSVS